MAIVLKNVKINNNQNIVLDSNEIIGVMGKDYEKFLKLLKNNNMYYLDKENNFNKENVYDEIKEKFSDKKDLDDIIKMLLKELDLDNSFVNKQIKDLSHSEKRLLCYLMLFIKNPSIIVIDEVFLYLDYHYKKKIKYLLKEIIKNTDKTIIIGSNRVDDIYSICDKLLIIKHDKCYYNNPSDIFSNLNIINEYGLDVPEIISFVNIAKEKRVNLNYTNDIRDLIKEVYKNV